MPLWRFEHNHYIRQEGYVLVVLVCLSVCLFCPLHFLKSNERICTILLCHYKNLTILLPPPERLCFWLCWFVYLSVGMSVALLKM